MQFLRHVKAIPSAWLISIWIAIWFSLGILIGLYAEAKRAKAGYVPHAHTIRIACPTCRRDIVIPALRDPQISGLVPYIPKGDYAHKRDR